MLANAIKSSPVVRLLIDLRVTVACLAALLVLTLLGTLYQVDNGIYAAQQRFFSAWITWLGGVIPFPGARLVLWVMFVNLIGATTFRFVYKWSRVGILIIHLGLYALFLGMFFTSYFSTESSLILQEGEGRNVSADYYEWELAVWRDGETSRHVVAIDIETARSGEVIPLDPYEGQLQIEAYYPNSRAYTRTGTEQVRYLNASNIGSLEAVRVSPKPEENAPGALVRLLGTDGTVTPVLLYGLDANPVLVTVGGTRLGIHLRPYQHLMPLVITLKDFRADFYPGSETPRSFESDVVLTTEAGDREAHISMNQPLRYGGYTFYQAAYNVDATGAEHSRLAVVHNRGRLVPYIGTAVVGLGLAIHFILTLTQPMRRRRTKNG